MTTSDLSKESAKRVKLTEQLQDHIRERMEGTDGLRAVGVALVWEADSGAAGTPVFCFVTDNDRVDHTRPDLVAGLQQATHAMWSRLELLRQESVQTLVAEERQLLHRLAQVQRRLRDVQRPESQGCVDGEESKTTSQEPEGAAQGEQPDRPQAEER